MCFRLKGKFCNDNDLRQSWTKTLVSKILLRIFGVLFNSDPKSYYDSNTSNAVNENMDRGIDQFESVANNKRRKWERCIKLCI